MVYAGPNVVNDRGDLRTAVGITLADHKNSDRLIIFAHAFRRRTDLHFGTECDLDEAFRDFLIGKIRSFGCAPAGDIRIFCHRRTDNESGS